MQMTVKDKPWHEMQIRFPVSQVIILTLSTISLTILLTLQMNDLYLEKFHGADEWWTPHVIPIIEFELIVYR